MERRNRKFLCISGEGVIARISVNPASDPNILFLLSSLRFLMQSQNIDYLFLTNAPIQPIDNTFRGDGSSFDVFDPMI